MDPKEGADRFYGVEDFVENNEGKLRKIIPNIIDEECIKERLTENQKEILRMFYVDNTMHEDIAERLNLTTNKVLEQEYRAFEGILLFLENCGFKKEEGLENLFQDDLVEKLRMGDEAIKRTMEELEKEKVFTKEELEIINNSFYVLKGIGEKSSPSEKISSQTMISKTLKKAERLFFARYKPHEF